MKIYSDVLTGQALTRALPAGCGFEKLAVILKPKLRRNAWRVLLYRNGSRRHFNTGKYGAGDEGAASYDDYGRWLARLYELDHLTLVVGSQRYESREDFHKKTGGKFDGGFHG